MPVIRTTLESSQRSFLSLAGRNRRCITNCNCTMLSLRPQLPFCDITSFLFLSTPTPTPWEEETKTWEEETTTWEHSPIRSSASMTKQQEQAQLHLQAVLRGRYA
jgi:hypothetical protein